ncbi:MAG: DUF2993 domain-containing protein [Armatimonadota bacterium]|nr:MAG: DUF2993 domain-containing protein [Armatimonadota bacterium]
MESLIAAILAALLSALGVTGKVERGVENSLRQQLGEVKQVKVDIHRGHRSPLSRQVDLVDITLSGFEARSGTGPGLEIGGGGDLVGKVGKVAIHARDFRVSDLPVDRLDITIRDVRYDLWKAIWRRKLEVIRVGESDAEISLNARALTRMLAPRVKQVENLKLTFEEGRINVSGDARFGLRIPVGLKCSLASVGGGKIYVVDPKASVSIVPVPSFVVSRLLDEINPLVDLNEGKQGPFRLEIDEIRITRRALRIHAKLLSRKKT